MAGRANAGLSVLPAAFSRRGLPGNQGGLSSGECAGFAAGRA